MKRALRLRSASAILLLIAGTPFYASEVLPNGSYAHTVEIQLPPGTNASTSLSAGSMQPKLALQYNSGAPNGIMGVGWSLQGLPAIMRGSKFEGGINYDVSDYLSGDGQDGYYFMGEPLVRVSDLGAPSVYHTRNESFSRYEPIGLCGDGPCSWRVTDRSGLVYLYGDSTDAKITADLPLNAANSVRLWALTRVIDLNGNFYEVRYRQDSGEIYPAKIIYTQNAAGGISRYRVVEFEYDENLRTDYAVGYAALSPVQTKWRLRDIVIKTNVITFLGITVPFTGDLVRRYHLEYEQSLYSRRSRLISLQEFGSDDTTALPPHRFEWHSESPTLTQTFATSAANSSWSSNYGNTLVADFNGDGKSDIALQRLATKLTDLHLSTGDTFNAATISLMTSTNGLEIHDYSGASTLKTTALADIDGDGRPDIVSSYAGNNTTASIIDLSIFSPNNLDNIGTHLVMLPKNAGSLYDATNRDVYTGDFDGDGRHDILLQAKTTGQASSILRSSHQINTLSFDRIEIVVPISGSDTLLIADFNGDARSDILQCSKRTDLGYSTVKLHLSSYDGTLAPVGSAIRFRTLDTPMLLPLDCRATVGDFNGDGKLDIISATGGYKLYLGNGHTFAAPLTIPNEAIALAGVHTANEAILLAGDFNADGRDDLFIYSNGAVAGAHITLSKGDGFVVGDEPNRFPWKSTDAMWRAAVNEIGLADFNGDGIADIYLNEKYIYGMTRNFTVFTSQTLFTDKLHRMISPQGMELTLEYTPASQMAGAVQPLAPHCYTQSGFYLCDPVKPYGNAVLTQPNPLRRALVSKTTIGDGRGATYSTAYEYNNARLVNGDFATRRDAGFEWVTKTNQTTGVITRSYFRQDSPDLAQRKWREEEYNGVGQLMLRMDNAWTSNATIYPDTHFVALNQQQISTYEAGNLLHTTTKNFTYDSYGNTVQVVDAASGTETIQTNMNYAVDTAQNILNRKVEEKQIFNPSGQNVIVSWKKMGYTGNVMTSDEKYLAGIGWLITYMSHDIYGNVISITDPRGAGPGDPAYTTYMAYDTDYHALRVQLVNPLGHVEKIRYDNLKINIAEEEDANGNIQRKEYDVFGRLEKIIEPGDVWTKEIIFANDGNPNAQFMEVRYADSSGTGFRFERSFYDGLNRIYKEQKKGYTEVDASNTTYTIDTLYTFFDETKKVSRQSKPFIADKQSPLFETIVYDNYVRPIQQQTADGYTVDFSYNVSCPVNTTCQTKEDAMGKIYKIVTDSRNRVIRREDPEGGLVVTEILPLQEKSYDAGGLVTTMNYDTAGRNTSMVDRNSGLWVYVRDNADNVTLQIAPDGRQIANTYDALNRLLLKSYPTSSTDDTPVLYEYDDASVANGKGRVTKITDASGETVFGYDAKGNITSWVKTMPNISGGGNFSVAFGAEYDQQKRIKKLTYPDGSAVTQFYADAGYLRQVRLLSPGGFFGSPVVTYEGPNLAQQFIRKTGNNVTEFIGYDPATHRPTSLETLLPSGTSMRKQTYSYDGNGNTLAITDILNAGARTETFSYDGLNRITSAVGAYGSKTYTHDARGRLTTKDSQAQSFGNASHPEAVTSSGEGAYAYDTNGNLTERLSRQYIYDSENRLKEIKLGTATKQNFIYDFSGMRAVKVREDGAKTYYFGGLKNYGALYEITLPPGSSIPQHTKYIYGINSDRAAQVTVPNANLVASSVNTENTLASIYGGSVSGTIISMSHTVSAYLIVASNVQRDLRVVFYICAVLILGIYLFRVAISGKGLRPSPEMAHQNRLAYHTAPLALIVFVFFYGVGCTTAPTGPSDPFPNSGDVSTAPGVTAPGGDTTTKGLPASGTFFLHYNHVGSLNYVTNTAGEVVSEYNYLPYGQLDLPRSSGPDIARYKFATYERDEETGLDNANARMYNAASGTFTSADTVIPGDGARSQGFNRYMYTEGNPVRYNDPSGHAVKPWYSFATQPPWHMYTGTTQRDDKFETEPVTALDAISKKHDEDGAQLFIDAHVGFGKNIDTQLKNIKADAKFIGKFLGKALSGGLYYENIGKAHDQLKAAGWGTVGSWVGGVVLGLYYFTTDVLIGAVAIVLFTANIIVNASVMFWTGVIKVAEGWGKLFSGRFKEWWNSIW